MDATTSDLLRRQFPAALVGKLPRVTCSDCSDRRKQCDRHEKQKCQVCTAYVSTSHIHIDYVGHADVTARLLDADPEWTWEPAGTDERGMPLVDTDTAGNAVGLWIRLTAGGVTRLGYGSCPSGQADAVKVLIGDALRNAAMRFGVALDLWAKGDRADPTAENATASAGQAARRQARPEPRQAPSHPDESVVADWGAKIDGITTADEARAVEAELKTVFGNGRMDSTTANAIKNAIRARGESLTAAGNGAGTHQPPDVDEQTASFASRAVAAADLAALSQVWTEIRAARKASASFMHEGKAITLGVYVNKRKAEMEAAQPETAGAR